MTVTIMDYQEEKVDCKITRPVEEIGKISIEVISGDEILKVIYTNFEEETFDSSDTRMTDYYDGEYTIYCPSLGINLLNNEEWLNRLTSYSYWLLDF